MKKRIEDIAKNIIIVLLNPISPVVTLLIGWLLTVLVTQPSDRFPDFINYLIENPFVIIIFVIFWLIFSVIYTEQKGEIQSLKNEVKRKNTVIEEKERQLNSTAGVVLNRVGDFADFTKSLRFKDALIGFVNNNPLVECAQIYNYSIKRIGEKIAIKVCYESGYAYEDIDINNIAQTYYEIEYKDYNSLKDIIKIWKELSGDNNKGYREIDALTKCIVSEITEIFKKYHNNLLNISKIDEIEHKHFTEYRILTLLLRLTRKLSTTTFDKYNILGDEKKDIENFLLNGKRTGILNSILLEDTVMFKYTRNSQRKNGRAYVSFHMNIANQNYIIIFSIQTNELDANTNLEHEITDLKNDFVKRMVRK